MSWALDLAQPLTICVTSGESIHLSGSVSSFGVQGDWSELSLKSHHVSILRTVSEVKEETNTGIFLNVMLTATCTERSRIITCVWEGSGHTGQPCFPHRTQHPDFTALLVRGLADGLLVGQPDSGPNTFYRLLLQARQLSFCCACFLISKTLRRLLTPWGSCENSLRNVHKALSLHGEKSPHINRKWRWLLWQLLDSLNSSPALHLLRPEANLSWVTTVFFSRLVQRIPLEHWVHV